MHIKSTVVVKKNKKKIIFKQPFKEGHKREYSYSYCTVPSLKSKLEQATVLGSAPVSQILLVRIKKEDIKEKQKL